MIKTCEHCKRKFKTYDKVQKFCSHKCYHEHQIKEHSDTCPICKKFFHKLHKNQKYCSIKCRNEAKITNRVKLICPICKKVFYKKQSDIKNVKGKPCCSLKCNHIYKQKYNFLNGKADKSTLYVIWNGMMQRCYNKKQKSYKHYGERGIQIFKSWQDFKIFYDWAMSNGYQEGLTIERIDVNSNYEPNNCKWIPMSEQAKNRTTNIRVLYKGQETILSEVAKAEKLNYKSLLGYYHRTKDINIAIKKARPL